MVTQINRRLLFDKPIPQYVAVGLHAPQNLIQVDLDGLGATRDVTYHHVVAALRPFTIVVGLAVSSKVHDLEQSSPRLVFRERSPGGKVLGWIRLRLNGVIPLDRHQLCLFETAGCANYCMARPLYYLHQVNRYLRERRQRSAHQFQMTRADRASVDVFYICPRPVVLVTTAYEDASNIFPMDLIGPVGAPYFLMALRNTSPAVRLMRQSRRMALSAMPIAYSPIVYELGQHHRKETIDWDRLPFATMASPAWGLPVPRDALQVSDVQVEQYHTIGSHTLFITTIAQQQQVAEGPQMFHICGLYQHYRTAQGRAYGNPKSQ